MGASVIFERDATSLLVAIENAAQFGEHRGAARIVGGGRVGTGEESGFEPFVIEMLGVDEGARVVRIGGEKGGEGGAIDVLVADGVVVGGVALQELLVLAEERRGVGAALVPDENDVAAGTEDSRELGAGPLFIEPVE